MARRSRLFGTSRDEAWPRSSPTRRCSCTASPDRPAASSQIQEMQLELVRLAREERIPHGVMAERGDAVRFGDAVDLLRRLLRAELVERRRSTPRRAAPSHRRARLFPAARRASRRRRTRRTRTAHHCDWAAWAPSPKSSSPSVARARACDRRARSPSTRAPRAGSNAGNAASAGAASPDRRTRSCERSTPNGSAPRRTRCARELRHTRS